MERRHQGIAVACTIIGTVLAATTLGRDFLKSEKMDAASRENERAAFARYSVRIASYCEDILPKTIRAQVDFYRVNSPPNEIKMNIKDLDNFRATLASPDRIFDETSVIADRAALMAYAKKRGVSDFDFMESSLTVISRDVDYLHQHTDKLNANGRVTIDPIFTGLFRAQETCRNGLTDMITRFTTHSIM
ncbi:hypothetical protein BLM15_07720 [Bosea sp. Tri-49]|nr:hypothetical protein BLM15_07720 [Bosea sp. Tri-49]